MREHLSKKQLVLFYPSVLGFSAASRLEQPPEQIDFQQFRHLQKPRQRPLGTQRYQKSTEELDSLRK